MAIKIGAISDLHGNWNYLNNLSGSDEIELLIIAGDLCSTDNIQEQKEELKYNLPLFLDQFTNVQDVIIVPGNHDYWLEQVYTDPFKIRMELGGKSIKILVDSRYEFTSWNGNGSIRIYGNPRCDLYDNFAFPRLSDGEDIKMIPPGIDILITHEAPRLYNHPSIRESQMMYYPDEPGNKMLYEKVKEIRPGVHIFGHIHYPSFYEESGIRFYNVSQILRTKPCPKLHIISVESYI